MTIKRIEQMNNFKAFVQVKNSLGIRTTYLHNLRSIVGSSSNVDVKIDSNLERVFGEIVITPNRPVYRVLNTSLPTMYQNRTLDLGEVINLSDSEVIQIGQTTLTIQMKAVVEECVVHSANVDKDAQSSAPVETSFRAKALEALLNSINLDALSPEQIRTSSVQESARIKARKVVLDLDRDQDVPEIAKSKIVEELISEIFGLGPLDELLIDPKVSEIMVNSPSQIYVERNGRLEKSPKIFSSERALLNVIERIVSRVGRRIDLSSPIVDARLQDGSRVNAIIPPLALKGATLTIRKFSRTPIKITDLVSFQSLSQSMLDFLKCAVKERKNIVISGGTGSGKTTLLNALSECIDNDERIITIEDAAELQLQQSHVVSLESRPANLEGAGHITIRDLVKNSLRMRPDRIIVGECRGAEALDMLQAMNTGHDGSMTTAHANNPSDLLRRIETMVLMAGMDLPLRAIREQVCSAICLIVQQSRRKDGKRLVSEISWLKGLNQESMQYEVLPLFSRNKNDTVKEHLSTIRKFLAFQNMNLNIRQRVHNE